MSKNENKSIVVSGRIWSFDLTLALSARQLVSLLAKSSIKNKRTTKQYDK